MWVIRHYINCKVLILVPVSLLLYWVSIKYMWTNNWDTQYIYVCVWYVISELLSSNPRVFGCHSKDKFILLTHIRSQNIIFEWTQFTKWYNIRNLIHKIYMFQTNFIFEYPTVHFFDYSPFRFVGLSYRPSPSRSWDCEPLSCCCRLWSMTTTTTIMVDHISYVMFMGYLYYHFFKISIHKSMTLTLLRFLILNQGKRCYLYWKLYLWSGGLGSGLLHVVEQAFFFS